MKRLSFLFLISFLTINLWAQFPSFNKNFDLCPINLTDKGSFITELYPEDSAIIFSGVTGNPNNGNACPHIGKMDYYGNIIWNKLLNTHEFASLNNGSQYLYKLDSNRYITIGTFWDSTIAYPDNYTHAPFFHYFNDNGDSLKTIFFRDTLNDRYVFNTALSKDKKYIYLTGRKESYSKYQVTINNILYTYSDTLALFLSKYDTAGNHIWTKQHNVEYQTNGAQNYLPYNIISKADGGIIMSGYGHNIPTPINYRYPIYMSFDSSGNQQWAKVFTPNNNTVFSDAMITTSENDTTFYFLTNGSTVNNTVNSPNLPPQSSLLYFGEINQFGDTLWTNLFSDTNNIHPSGYLESRARNLIYRKGKLYIMGYVYYDGYYHPTLIITDSDSGIIKSYREFYSIKHFNISNELYPIRWSPHDNILMSGYVQNQAPIPGYLDSVIRLSWVLMTDSFGCEVPGCEQADTIWNINVSVEQIVKNELNIIAYPNPTQGNINLKTELVYDLRLYNINGQFLHGKKTIKGNYSYDLSNYPIGSYIVIIEHKGQQKTFKIQKE